MKVIKKAQIECPCCKAVIEFDDNEVKEHIGIMTHYTYIICPVCKKEIKINNLKRM